jgi:hypothetical protein
MPFYDQLSPHRSRSYLLPVRCPRLADEAIRSDRLLRAQVDFLLEELALDITQSTGAGRRA